MWERPYLDYLLNEMRRWVTAGLVAPENLETIYAVYAHRRHALDGKPVPSLTEKRPSFDLAEVEAAPGGSAPAPVRGPRPAAPVSTTAEPPQTESNLNTLLVVGSLLLLGGLGALVRWQWESFGRGVLVVALAAIAAGLLFASTRIRAEHPRSARTFLLLGATLLPLDLAAVNALILGLPWPPVMAAIGAITAAGVGALYRRADEPLLLPLAAGGVGLVAIGAATGLSSPWDFVSFQAIALGTALGGFALSRRLDAPSQPVALGSGHTALVVAVVAAVVRAGGGWGTPGQYDFSAALFAATLIYGVMGAQLRSVALHAAAIACVTGAILGLGRWDQLSGFGVLLSAEGIGLALVAAALRRANVHDPEPYRAVGLTVGAVGVVLCALTGESNLSALAAVAALLWLAIGRVARDPDCLYPAIAGLLAAVHLVAARFDPAVVVALGGAVGDSGSRAPWPPTSDRWMLAPSLLMALVALRLPASPARTAVERGAITAAAVAGVAAFGALVAGTPSESATGAALLLGLALAVTFWSRAWALLPWAAAELVLTGNIAFNGREVLSPWVSAAVAVGLALRMSRPSLRLCLATVAAGHLGHHLLVRDSVLFWPVAVAPVLALLGARRDEESRRVADVLSLLGAALVVIHGAAHAAMPSVVAGTVLGLMAFAVSAAVRAAQDQDGIPLDIAAMVASAAVALGAARFPSGPFDVDTLALTLAALAWGWVGVGAALRSVAWAERRLDNVSLAVGGIGAIVGAGAMLLSSSVSGVLATTIAGGAAVLLGERRRDAAAGAWGITCVVAPATLTALSRLDQPLYAFCAIGLGLAALGAGVRLGVRSYVAAGVAAVVAVLARTLWEPLRQIHFGFYLTLLGVAVLAVAFQFEKRRAQIQRWTERARGTWEGWR